MYKTPLDRFFDLEREKYGGADYYFKPDRKISAVRAFYARPFCPEYMDSFTTTMYPNTFFAGKKRGRLQSCLETEYHENVHKWDRWSEGFKFNLKYLWPHWMGPPFMLAAIALGGLWSWIALVGFIGVLHLGLAVLALSAKFSSKGIQSGWAQGVFYVLVGLGLLALFVINVWTAKYWTLLWLGAVLFFSPWPFKPFWRRNYEIRGYTMTLYRIWLKYKDDFSEEKFREEIEWCVRAFTGPAYFFMEINEDLVRKELLFQSARMQFSERGFLSHWMWRQSLGKPSKKAAEPFRMARQFMSREGFYG